MLKALAISLLLLGDLNFTGTQYLETFSRSGYDPAFSFAATTAEISAADIAIANLEGPLTFADWSETGKNKDWPFRQLPLFAKGIKAAGIDVLLLGNNHIADAGEQGIADTERALDETGIRWAPSPRLGPLAIERQGQRLDLWNADLFSPAGSTPWAVDAAELAKLIQGHYASKARPALALAVLHYHRHGVEPLPEKEAIALQLRRAGLDWVVFGGDHDASFVAADTAGGVHYGLGDFLFGCECSGAAAGKALWLEPDLAGPVARDVSVVTGLPVNGYVSRFLPATVPVPGE